MTNRDHESDLTRDFNRMVAGDGAAACRWLLASGLNAGQARCVRAAAGEIDRLRALLGRADPVRCPDCGQVRERAEVTGQGVCGQCGSGPEERAEMGAA